MPTDDDYSIFGDDFRLPPSPFQRFPDRSVSAAAASRSAGRRS